MIVICTLKSDKIYLKKVFYGHLGTHFRGIGGGSILGALLEAYNRGLPGALSGDRFRALLRACFMGVLRGPSLGRTYGFLHIDNSLPFPNTSRFNFQVCENITTL